MDNRRQKKIEEMIQHTASSILLFNANNPRLQNVRITRVKMSPDMSFARLYFQMPEGKVRAEEVLKELRRSKGFLKNTIGEKIALRRMPQIDFHYDETADLEHHIDQLFAKLEKDQTPS